MRSCEGIISSPSYTENDLILESISAVIKASVRDRFVGFVIDSCTHCSVVQD
jgi:hypothetical protein